jgi:hypothetical protein
VEVHTTERTRHFLVKKPKKILQLRLEDKNVFNAIHLNSIGYVFEFGNRGQIEKIGSQAHFKKLLRQISLNKLEESPLPVKKTKTEKKKKQTSKKSE